jgi:phosphoribosylpyrophosphate synthetase
MPEIKSVYVTDTIATPLGGWNKLRVVPVGAVFAHAVRRYIERLHRG